MSRCLNVWMLDLQFFALSFKLCFVHLFTFKLQYNELYSLNSIFFFHSFFNSSSILFFSLFLLLFYSSFHYYNRQLLNKISLHFLYWQVRFRRSLFWEKGIFNNIEQLFFVVWFWLCKFLWWWGRGGGNKSKKIHLLTLKYLLFDYFV